MKKNNIIAKKALKLAGLDYSKIMIQAIMDDIQLYPFRCKDTGKWLFDIEQFLNFCDMYRHGEN